MSKSARTTLQSLVKANWLALTSLPRTSWGYSAKSKKGASIKRKICSQDGWNGNGSWKGDALSSNSQVNWWESQKPCTVGSPGLLYALSFFCAATMIPFLWLASFLVDWLNGGGRFGSAHLLLDHAYHSPKSPLLSTKDWDCNLIPKTNFWTPFAVNVALESASSMILVWEQLYVMAQHFGTHRSKDNAARSLTWESIFILWCIEMILNDAKSSFPRKSFELFSNLLDPTILPLRYEPDDCLWDRKAHLCLIEAMEVLVVSSKEGSLRPCWCQTT